MVQILPSQPTFGSQFGAGLGSGFSEGISKSLPQTLNNFFEEKKKDKNLQNLLSSEFGESLSPEQKAILTGVTKNLLPPAALSTILESFSGKGEADEENVEIMKDAFGEKFANIWKATGQGERTALTNAALDARFRGINIQDLLSGIGDEKKETARGDDEIRVSTQLDTPQGEIGETEEATFPSYSLETRGMTPKDMFSYRSQLRKDNLKPFQEAKDKSRATNAELNSIKALNNLNESRKLPETIGHQLGQGINPLSGKIVLPQVASTEAQVFEKTINDFTTKAKDSFGARVTNFELQRFLARLPRLINSYEGRKSVTEQMALVTELNNLYNNSLKEVYQKYGLDNITPEDAERIAEERIEDKVKGLEQRYREVDARISSLNEKENKPKKFTTPPSPAKNEGRIIRDDQGNRYRSDGKSWRKI